MSFKRDGHDSRLLKKLQHKKVAEMLGAYIPDDEAKLLSNGRLTCTICSRKPIFDTMQMLSLHRKGKKHLYELSRYLQYKRDVESKKVKQIQKSFLKTEQRTVDQNCSSSFSLVSYVRNPMKRKSCSNPSRKKFALDAMESGDRIKSNLNPCISISLSANSQVCHYLKSLSKKRSLEKTVTTLRETYGGKLNSIKVKPESKSERQKPEESTCNRGDISHKIKLLESGWVQDLNGEWVKNPDVEFDSDEEQPPAFP